MSRASASLAAPTRARRLHLDRAAALAFARLRWRGRDFLFALLIATMFLPAQVTIIPLFLLWRDLGWLNTLWPMIVPSWLGHALYIFLMRQFVLTIPNELDDAARI